MSKKANPKLIGGFVLGAVALVVVGVLVFGGGRWFAQVETYVSFFRGSVQGLGVGSPVTFRGVPIGQVKQVDLLYDVEQLDFLIEVVFETDSRSFRQIGEDKDDTRTRLDRLIKNGLRAQLVQQSFVTGQLAVQVDMFPGTKAQLVGLDPDVIEIPTIPSTVEALEGTIRRIAEKLDQMDFTKVVDDLEAIVASIKEIVASNRTEKTIANIDQAVVEARELLTKLNSHVDPLATSFEEASQTAQGALSEAQRMFVDARAALGRMEKTLARAETLMTSANTVIEPGSALQFELVTALREVSGAARSLRSLANALERNPNSLLFGRQAPGGR
jgi:paraquat-inducible protein B